MLVIYPIIFCPTLSVQRIFSFQMHAQELPTYPFDGSLYAYLISTNSVYVYIQHIALWKELFVRSFYALRFWKRVPYKITFTQGFSKLIRFASFSFPYMRNVMSTDSIYEFRSMVCTRTFVNR